MSKEDKFKEKPESDGSKILNFVSEYQYMNLSVVYLAALKILGEKVKDQWTNDDVVDVILRAYNVDK